VPFLLFKVCQAKPEHLRAIGWSAENKAHGVYPGAFACKLSEIVNLAINASLFVFVIVCFYLFLLF
jgi:hypothetical protein